MNTDLLERLHTEADLCRNETADDVAALLDEAADAITKLRANSELDAKCGAQREETLGGWIKRARIAEAELAALKRRIAEAPVDVVVADTPPSKFGGIIAGHVPAKLIGQTVVLLPVGGEHER
jgi:hypothetical protein